MPRVTALTAHAVSVPATTDNARGGPPTPIRTRSGRAATAPGARRRPSGKDTTGTGAATGSVGGTGGTG